MSKHRFELVQAPVDGPPCVTSIWLKAGAPSTGSLQGDTKLHLDKRAGARSLGPHSCSGARPAHHSTALASKDINFGNRDLSSSLAQSSSDQCHHKTCYNTTTFLISSASRLQRLPEATRNSVLTCLRSQFSARTPSMSSRKSARISAASLEAKENAVPEQTTKNVNASRKRKNPATEAAPSSKELSSGPSTPKRKRAAIPAPPPVTPTPSAIGLIAAPVPFGDMAPHAVNRLALPNGTNATLVTPETHRVVANKPLDQVSPSKVSKVKSTSGNILDEGVAHLIKVEPKLKPVIEKHPCHMFSPEGLAEEIDPFMSLTSGIISQQVRRNA